MIDVEAIRAEINAWRTLHPPRLGSFDHRIAIRHIDALLAEVEQLRCTVADCSCHTGVPCAHQRRTQ
jgi:hypothetical protein